MKSDILTYTVFIQTRTFCRFLRAKAATAFSAS